MNISLFSVHEEGKSKSECFYSGSFQKSSSIGDDYHRPSVISTVEFVLVLPLECLIYFMMKSQHLMLEFFLVL